MKLSKCTMHFKNAAYYISPGFSMLCSASSPVPHMKMYEALQQWNLHGGPGMQPETRSSHVHNGTETFYQDCNLAICSARTVQPCIYSLSWKHNNFLRSPTAVWILPYDLFKFFNFCCAICVLLLCLLHHCVVLVRGKLVALDIMGCYYVANIVAPSPLLANT